MESTLVVKNCEKAVGRTTPQIKIGTICNGSSFPFSVTYFCYWLALEGGKETDDR